MELSVIKKNNHDKIYVPVLLLFVLASCSTSKKAYFFRLNPETHHTSSPHDTTLIRTELSEVETTRVQDSAFNKNETEFMNQNSYPLPLQNKSRKNSLAKTNLQADPLISHPDKSSKLKTQKYLKTEKEKGSKIGILIIALLAIIILGAVIVNNSIPDFGPGNIFHF